jgi:hypothetical protein
VISLLAAVTSGVGMLQVWLVSSVGNTEELAPLPLTSCRAWPGPEKLFSQKEENESHFTQVTESAAKLR